jgi:hypothetical protein
MPIFAIRRVLSFRGPASWHGGWPSLFRRFAVVARSFPVCGRGRGIGHAFDFSASSFPLNALRFPATPCDSGDWRFEAGGCNGEGRSNLKFEISNLKEGDGIEAGPNGGGQNADPSCVRMTTKRWGRAAASRTHARHRRPPGRRNPAERKKQIPHRRGGSE